MRTIPCLLVLALVGLAVPPVSAQEKSGDAPKKTDGQSEAEKPVVPLKVTVVFNEYDGDKKVSSLPYVLFLKTSEEHRSYFGTVRMGVRVPIWTGGKESAIQYNDVGSNIDCEVHPLSADRYILDLRLERSSIYAPNEDHRTSQAVDEQPHQPVVRQFRSNVALALRDGQTTQSTMATDPLNGHTIRVDVTLNVLK